VSAEKKLQDSINYVNGLTWKDYFNNFKNRNWKEFLGISSWKGYLGWIVTLLIILYLIDNGGF